MIYLRREYSDIYMLKRQRCGGTWRNMRGEALDEKGGRKARGIATGYRDKE